jgi:hypothetical protein
MKRANSRHHRRARVHGGKNGDNVVMVDQRLNRAYHQLFGPGDVHHIAQTLNETWIDERYVLVVQLRQQNVIPFKRSA